MNTARRASERGLAALAVVVLVFSVGSANSLAATEDQSPATQHQQIAAGPLPERSAALIPPLILQKGVQWTTRNAEAVAYLWGAELQNENDLPVIATVVLRLHDATDNVIYEDELEFVLAPGDSREFSEEGQVPQGVALLASHWTFDATARPFEPILAPDQPEVGAAQIADEVALVVDLDAEEAYITNNGLTPLLLAGWNLSSTSGGQRFILPDVTLQPGQTVSITSGTDARHRPPQTWLWTTANVWNNAGDTGELRDPSGQLIATSVAVTTPTPPDVALTRDEEVTEEPLVAPEPNVSRPREPLEIVDVQIRPTEMNNSWWRMAWQLTVRNSTGRAIEFDTTIEFLDSDGFVVDDTNEYGSVVLAGQSRTFTGYDLVDTSVAPSVVGVKAKLRHSGGEVESAFDPSARFPIQLQVTHRHFASAPRATLSLYEDRIEFAEFGNAEHRFSVPTRSVTKLDWSVLDDTRLTWTLHFSQDTRVGDKATMTLDVMGRNQLLLFVDRYCPNAEIKIPQ